MAGSRSRRTLFHVSEDPDIGVFAPRSSKGVWAITAERLPNYLLPRDCPRVTFHARADMSAADRDRFLGRATIVIAIEAAWYARCASTSLTVYEFAAEPFVLEDEIAGYYTTRETVNPTATRHIVDPIAALREAGAELRVLDCLWQLREDVACSTLGFSIIRFRNAAPPPAGFVSRFDVPRARP